MMHQHNLLNDENGFDYARMIAFLQTLSEQDTQIRFQYLGESILGNGIPLVSIGEGKNEILYVGAHHGMEWITSLILCRFLKDFSELRRKKETVFRLSIELLCRIYTLHVIPMLNPDGVQYQMHGLDEDNPLRERVLSMNGQSTDFTRWQANARGVDLNHNYDAGFWEYKKLEKENGIEGGAPTRFSGEAPESEPEVSALCSFIRFHGNLKGIITLHTQGEEIFFRSGNVTLRKSEKIAKKMASLCGYNLSLAEGMASYGGLTDWCIQKMALPSFTVECGKGQNPLPISDYLTIYHTIRKLLFLFPTLL